MKLLVKANNTLVKTAHPFIIPVIESTQALNTAYMGPVREAHTHTHKIAPNFLLSKPY